MEHIALPTRWTLCAVDGPVPAEVRGRDVEAQVPGTVHTDLLAAGLIPDPYLDSNEALLTWIGRSRWQYRATFDVPTGTADRLDLVCEGLDTVSSIEINGKPVGETSNQHRTYRFDVADAVVAGENTITVEFASALDEVQQWEARLAPRPRTAHHSYNAIRKSACNFGWDWGPDVVTAGIWREIGLQAWSGARLSSVRPVTSVEEQQGVVRVHVTLERAGTADDVTVVATLGEQSTSVVIPADASEAVVEIRVDDPDLWWPRGYGHQHLYPVSVLLSTPEGHQLDHWSSRVGFRTVTIDQSPDESGRRFVFVVNGVEVFVKGTNWIPDDCFFPRVGRERYRERLLQGIEANMNLVRVWGGGTYEADAFYELCDELGLMVWQDFLFACAAYSEEDPLRAEVLAEARDNVTRLMPHPSLVVWNGCNENIWGYEDWGWKPELGDRTWGWGYYTHLLPAVVAELDPGRAYLPGSPFSPDYPAVHPNAPSQGVVHEWDVWNRADYTHYRDIEPRFVAEFGYQGPPTWATLTRAVHEDERRPDSPSMLNHQKAADGLGKLSRGMAPHLPSQDDVASWHWATSLQQARAIAFGITHFRSLAPRCSGVVLWQLNDCWPVISWAVVDGDGRLKPAWYAMRDAFADRLVTIQPRDGALSVVLVNDTDETWHTQIRAARTELSGHELASWDEACTVAPRSVSEHPLPRALQRAADPRREALWVEADGAGRDWHYDVEDVELELPEPVVDAVAEPVPAGWQITVRARSFVKDLAVLADRCAPDAVADTMLLTLLPGEEATVTVTTGARDVDPSIWTQPEVLRSANQLRHPDGRRS